MKQDNSLFIVAAAVCGWLACVGDFVITFFLESLYPGYNFIYQTESYLGTSDSPVASYMNVWGVTFFILVSIFAAGFSLAFLRQEKWAKTISLLIFLYGLGEGAGSGIFPFDHVNGKLTFSGLVHSVFSAAGVLSMVLVPVVALKLFPKRAFPRLNFYAMFTSFAGVFFILLFLASKLDMISYRGLWQRSFILVYHIFLTVLAVQMLNRYKKGIETIVE